MIREQRFALFVLLAVVLVHAVSLSAELTLGRVTGNDNISHLSLLKGMVRAVETGQNPLDFWSPEASLGSPILRTYQPLAHALVALIYFALGKTVSLTTVFLWVRYLSIVLLPAGFFAAARLMGFSPLTAAASALLAPLLSTANFYGLDDSSYVTAGRGLFPQSVAAILLLLAIGYGFRAVRTGRVWALAGLFLGLTATCHFIYGWMGAVTLCLAALLPDPDAARWLRIRRIVCIGMVAAALSAFQLLPVLLDGRILNHSHWEESWKWDSYGAASVLTNLFSGELLDHARPPVLSLLTLCGAGLLLWTLWKTRLARPREGFVLAAAFLWLLIFFGRPTWGPLLMLLGVTRDLHLHRTIGGLHIFLVLLGAIAMAAGWRELGRRGHAAIAVIATFLLLAPMIVERARYLAHNEAEGSERLSAVDAEQGSLDAVMSNLARAGGRAYAGSGLGWGPQFQVGGIPFFAFLNTSLIPQVSTTYHMLALTAEILPLFDESRPAHYNLFHVTSGVAPPNRVSALPGFLSKRGAAGRFQIFNAPGGGYFDLVNTSGVVAANKDNFFALNEEWLKSDAVEKKTHLLLDFGDGPPSIASSDAPAGAVRGERQVGQVYSAEVDASRPAYALFKMTWHPNWVARVDGKVQKTAMLSPGFIGVPVAPGQHQLVLSYEPGWWKVWLALGGLLAALSAVAAERYGLLNSLTCPSLEVTASVELPAVIAPRKGKRGRS